MVVYTNPMPLSDFDGAGQLERLSGLPACSEGCLLAIEGSGDFTMTVGS
jgi:hypothetical protein